MAESSKSKSVAKGSKKTRTNSNKTKKQFKRFPSKSTKGALKPTANRKLVKPTALTWRTVHLPSEALAGGAGINQSDFFDSLNWNDAEYMGLQEIDDVDIIKEVDKDGSKTVSFLASETKIKGSKKVEPQVPIEEPKDQPSKSQKRKIEEVEQEVEDQEENESDHGDGSEVAESQNEVSEHDLSDEEDEMDDEELAAAFHNAHNLNIDEEEDEEEDSKFQDSLLPAWSNLPLHGALKRALLHKNFIQPTEIQEKSLKFALGLESDVSDSQQTTSQFKPRDVIGVSQTGSGKTLAFGLAILNHLYQNPTYSLIKDGDSTVPPPLGALIICPTRELALQVSSHLNDIVKSSCIGSDEEINKKKLMRRPQIAVVCGGMSEQKQRRLLEGRCKGIGRNGVDIIVATPGRLWEMTRLDDHLAARIKQTRFLVLDEADRMVEVGHFAEMEQILNLVNRVERRYHPSESEDDEEDQKVIRSKEIGIRPNSYMQTFVFSATLSKTLQINLKRRKKVKQFTKKKHMKEKPNDTTLEDLMDRIDFRDEEPIVIDLTPNQGLPDGLMETRLECVSKDKDLYLYYFLLRYPGRTLVFVNSIDGIRRLAPILNQLNILTYPIHSQLQQKQRLKNLDRFRSFDPSGKSKNCVLLATDVAARGLDIPSVEHVVHYQIPRTADTYVHRSGRTARAGTSGVSLSLIEPKEKALWIKLSHALGRKSEVPTFPITFSTLTQLRERVELALAIDRKTHANSKQTYEDNWINKLAEEADLDISEDEADPDAPESSNLRTSRGKAQTKINNNKLNDMKAELNELLNRKVTIKGCSHRYLTANGLTGSSWVDDLVTNTNHDQILGVKNTNAQTDLKAKQTKSLPQPKKLKPDGTEETVSKKRPSKQASKANPASKPAPLKTKSGTSKSNKSKKQRIVKR